MFIDVCRFEQSCRLGLPTIPAYPGVSMQKNSLPHPSPFISFQLKCPDLACDSSVVHLLVRSTTVATFRCATCQFAWSAHINELPSLVRRHLVARDLSLDIDDVERIDTPKA
jgi:hypothetical protein